LIILICLVFDHHLAHAGTSDGGYPGTLGWLAVTSSGADRSAIDVSPDRSSLRTVFRDTFRSRAISLIVLPLIKCSRRIRPIVSTVSIRPRRSLESRREAHQAKLQGVNFGCRSPGSGGQNCTPNDSQTTPAKRNGMPELRGDNFGRLEGPMNDAGLFAADATPAAGARRAQR
jgi:hypothetical protein